MQFSPFNPIVKLCLQGIQEEESQNKESAIQFFTQAWNEASNDFEKYLAAHFLSRNQQSAIDRLWWLETTLKLALTIQDDSVKSALPTLYSNLAKCHNELGNNIQANDFRALALHHTHHPTDPGPFYHGTKANLQTGDLLTAGGISNYQPDLLMHHIYFTALIPGAALAACLANGEGPERIYRIEPTGNFENDPNVTNKKFPGNPTRSYRSNFPLKLIEEVKDWVRPNPEEIQKIREKLAKSKGEIIN